MKPITILSWAVRGIAAAIMLQSLFFKFSGAPESIYIFTTVGGEPWMRYATGFAELVASILLFVPGKQAYGALLGLGVISGAIFFHLTQLGVVVQNDGGTLFIMACVVFVCCAIAAYLFRRQIPVVGAKLG
jgi:FtsH-binding integral membrane protein